MDQTRIAELLQPFLAAPLTNQQPAILSNTELENISTYIDILARWNDRINLTAIRDPEQIVTRHFGESLFAARVLFPRTTGVGTPARSSALLSSNDHGRTPLQVREKSSGQKEALAPQANDQRLTANDAVADVGSGAGFPGIPLKLWNPAIHLTLIESNQKKSTFLKELARVLILTDINIQNARAESLPNSSFDVVTLRAVERFESVLPVAATLVKPHGRLALLIGASQRETARSLLPNLAWFPALPLPVSQARILLVGHHQPAST